MNQLNHFDIDSSLHEFAKLRAEELRREAMSQFWDYSACAARRAVRSTQRLAKSLARHVRLRGEQGA